MDCDSHHDITIDNGDIITLNIFFDVLFPNTDPYHLKGFYFSFLSSHTFFKCLVGYKVSAHYLSFQFTGVSYMTYQITQTETETLQMHSLK